MSDEYWRRSQGALEVVDLGAPAWSVPPPLGDARVAIVTTAGLRVAREGRQPWRVGDLGFAVLPAEERDLTMAHASHNFDRTGYLSDLNVVYPVERLRELEERGVIGSVAARHLSFMGAQVDFTLETLRLDTGPAAAELLREDGVDVAILTPV